MPGSATVILVPHFNNLRGLKTTLHSIWHPVGIDVLVVDDGSESDQIPRVSSLENDVHENVSLEIIHINKNKGITRALNLGLDHILKKRVHEFVARLDCGDTCVVNRFLVQENFLNTNVEIDIVGSWVEWFDNKSGEGIFCNRPPISHKKIKQRMSIRCNIIHPSVMFRVSLVTMVGKYPLNYEAAEDYAYFFNIVNKSQTANIPKFLTKAEFNKNGISYTKRLAQNKSKLKIVLKYGEFNFHFIYGIFYNLLLMVIPYHFLFRIKEELYRP